MPHCLPSSPSLVCETCKETLCRHHTFSSTHPPLFTTSARSNAYKDRRLLRHQSSSDTASDCIACWLQAHQHSGVRWPVQRSAALPGTCTISSGTARSHDILHCTISPSCSASTWQYSHTVLRPGGKQVVYVCFGMSKHARAPATPTAAAILVSAKAHREERLRPLNRHWAQRGALKVPKPPLGCL